MAARIRFRPPGVKHGSRIGPLGPFRGTLGIQWVVGAIAVGLVLVLATTYAWLKTPGPPYVQVGDMEDFPPGEVAEVSAHVWFVHTEDGETWALAEPVNCPLTEAEGHFLDCAERKYGLDGRATGRRTDLVQLPLEIRRGTIYVDPTAAEAQPTLVSGA